MIPTARLCSIAALSALLGASCLSTGDLPADEAGPSSATSVFHPADAASPPVLYARDGSVVSGGGAASAPLPQAAGPQRRDVGQGESGRMYLLELYQQVIDERDGLAREVASLQADLRQSRAAEAAAAERITELERRVTLLADENAALQAETLDLAGRLTTAQVRRLQAEKLLLERRIAERRAAQAAAEGASASEGARAAPGASTVGSEQP